MSDNFRTIYAESNGHNVRYVTFHFFGATEEEIKKAVEAVFPGYYISNGYIDDEMKYACVDVSKACTCDAEDLSAKLPGVTVYGENGWTECEPVTMCAYRDGKEFDGYMIARPEDIEDNPTSNFGEYDEFNELYWGLLTIVDLETGMRIEFGCSGVEEEEIEGLQEIIDKHPYRKEKDKRREFYDSQKQNEQ